jgi:hypothetical protein
MKHFFAGTLFLLSTTFTIAQEVAISKDGKSVPILLNMSGNLITKLKSGDIKGSPMLSEHWTIGNVSFKNGKHVDSVQLHFNLETNKLVFRQEGLMLEFVDTVQQADLHFKEQGNTGMVIIKNNYPPIGNYTAETFYIIMADGPRYQLLTFKTKKKVEQYNYGNASTTAYTELNEFFIYEKSTDIIHKVKVKKSSIQKALPQKSELIEKICSQHSIQVKNLAELTSLITLLNEN